MLTTEAMVSAIKEEKQKGGAVWMACRAAAWAGGTNLTNPRCSLPRLAASASRQPPAVHIASRSTTVGSANPGRPLAGQEADGPSPASFKRCLKSPIF